MSAFESNRLSIEGSTGESSESTVGGSITKTLAGAHFWDQFPPEVIAQLKIVLPNGIGGLRYRKGQRYSVGLERPAGVLLGWRPSSNTKNRHVNAVIFCSRCHQVWENRMDHFLDRNKSCGCGMVSNRQVILENIVASIPEDAQTAIAKELELGLQSRHYIATHFGLYGDFVPYVLNRIWKLWAVDLWQGMGEIKMRKVWSCANRIGVRKAAQIFHLVIAEVRAVLRWAKKNLIPYRTVNSQFCS
jgi:hypothetical protein